MGRPPGIEWRALRVALRRVGELAGFALLPAAVALVAIGGSAASGSWLYDFHGDLYDAGTAILAGHDPYPITALDHLAAVARAGGHPSQTFATPVYPAPALLAFTPLALLPFTGAAVVFLGLSVVSVAGALRLLGVRDWRCYGAAFLSWPVIHGLRLGALTPALMLGVAAAWRFRDTARAGAGALAAAVVAKLFLWPLPLWHLATRRWRTAAAALLAAVAALLAGWAVLGFAGLTAYPRLLSDLDAVEGSAGISVTSAGAVLGLPHAAGQVLSLILAAALLALARARLRGGDSGAEAAAFGLVLIAALVASPLVWPHYLALLYVPIALRSPRLSPLWLVPLTAWLAPVELTHGSLWRIAPHLFVVGCVAGALARAPARARTARRAAPAVALL